MTTAPLPKGALPWDQLRSRLDESQPFNLMRNTPYYRDAVYEQFSREEYARRYAAAMSFVLLALTNVISVIYIKFLQAKEAV